MKYFILSVIFLSILILSSCRDTVTPTGPIPEEVLVLSVDSVYFNDQSANMFSIDTTFQNCTQKKFRLTFTASTNDDDTTNSYLSTAFIDSTKPMWSFYKKGSAININLNETINLNYNNPSDIRFFFVLGFNKFHNPPQFWLRIKNLKLYSVVTQK